MSSDKITFYSDTFCPFAQRVAVVLKEVGAEHDTVLIDLANKPDWYGTINPDLKVPAMTIGDQKIAESLVIIQYISDLYPEKKLLPDDPLKRAYIRYAIEFFGTKIFSEYYKYLKSEKTPEIHENYKKNFNTALERLSEFLVQQSPTGPYFLGEQFSLADIAMSTILLRITAYHRYFLDGYQFDAVNNSPRLQSFLAGALNRPSVRETYCGDDHYFEVLAKNYNIVKK